MSYYSIGKSFRWEAAHSLPHLEDGHKCRRIHGHNYKAEVLLERSSLDADGFVVDFGVVSRTLGTWIKENWDHRFLNGEDGHPDSPPRGAIVRPSTAEMLAAHLFNVAASYGIGPLVQSVTVWETEDSWATFSE